MASIAAESGVSRAVLARRFNELVSEPPMSFLTSWRIDVAADLLRRPDTIVGAVAQQVGYSSPHALSTAFNRVRGISPQQHRELVSSSPFHPGPSASRSARSALEAQPFLLASDEGDDGLDIVVGEALDRFHVAELPMVLW